MTANGKIEEPTAKLGSSASFAHLKAYPLVADLFSLIQSYTLFTYFINYYHAAEKLALPYYGYIPTSVISVLGKIDTVVDDKLLTKLDQTIPKITQVGLHELSPKVVYDKIVAQLKSTVSSATELLTEKFNAVKAKGRPIVSNSTGPVLSPINNAFESLIDTYLPKPSVVSEVTPSLAPKDEIDRFLDLTSSAYTRSIPLVSSTKEKVLSIPTHISDTYKEEFSSTKSTPGALKSTSRKLSSELLESLKPIVAPLISTVDTIKSSAKVKVNDVVSATKDNIDSIVSEAKSGVENVTPLNGSASGPTIPVVSASA